jgi:ATP-dependent DNA ligase
MLARSGPLPTGGGWRFEPKLDGFRCLTCTHGGRVRVRSHRGWDMTTLVPELAELPADVQLDGELIAWATRTTRLPAARPAYLMLVVPQEAAPDLLTPCGA